MKIFHASDLHYAVETLREVDKCFSHAVQSVVDVDAAVISGDSTDHEIDLHSPASAALVMRIGELANKCPVLMLQGTFSHEPPGTLEVFKHLGSVHPVYVADRICQVALMEDDTWLESSGWKFAELPKGMKALFSVLPTVNKGHIAASMEAGKAAEAVGDLVSSILSGWANNHEQASLAGVPSVVVSHGTVNGSITEHGVPMAGMDHEFTVGSLFASGASAIMLGHIHRYQVWDSNGRLAAYAGSIGRLHYGEEGEKGYLVWNVEAHASSLEFVPTPARKMIHLEFDGVPDVVQLQAAAADAEGAFVRVRWQIDEEHKDAINRKEIAAIFGSAVEVKMEGRINPIVRTRAQGISNETTLNAKLQKWAETTQTPLGPLSEKLSLLERMSPEEIAHAAMS